MSNKGVPLENSTGVYLLASHDGSMLTQVVTENDYRLLSRSGDIYYLDNSVFMPMSDGVTYAATKSSLLDYSHGVFSGGLYVEQGEPSIFNTCVITEGCVTEPPGACTSEPVNNTTSAANATILLPSSGSVSLPPEQHMFARKHAQRICLLCNVQMDTLKSYRCHMTSHEKDRQFKCSQCDSTFNHSNNFIIHKALENQGKSPFSCPLCNSSYSRFAAFKSHLSIHESVDTLPCSICHIHLPSPSMLSLHMKLEHEFKGVLKQPSIFNCRLCQKQVSSVGELLKHYRSSHPQQLKTKKAKCSNETDPDFYSGRSVEFSTNDVLSEPRRSKLKARENLSRVLAVRKKKRHACHLEVSIDKDKMPPPMKIIKRPRKSGGRKWKPLLLSCPICRRRFRTVVQVRFHLEQHSNPKPFKCNLCGARFTQKDSAKSHMHKIHNCLESCTESFRSDSLSAKLMNGPSEPCVNLASITPVETNKISVCVSPSSFSLANEMDSSNMNSAIMNPSQPLANETKTSTDTACMLSSQQELNVSLNSREVCGLESSVGFSSNPKRSFYPNCIKKPLKWNHKQHVFINSRHISQNKPYKCPDCTHSYTHMHHLSFHMRQRHRRDQAPYLCGDCPRRFISSRGLERHKNVVHTSSKQLTQVSCSLCSKVLSCRSSLRRHMAIHSNEKNYRCPICNQRFKFHSSCSKHIRRHGQLSENQQSSHEHILSTSNVLPASTKFVQAEYLNAISDQPPCEYNTSKFDVLHDSVGSFSQIVDLDESSNTVPWIVYAKDQPASHLHTSTETNVCNRLLQNQHPYETSAPNLRGVELGPTEMTSSQTFHSTTSRNIDIVHEITTHEYAQSFFGCGLCVAQFFNAEQLRVHVNTDHLLRPKPFKCDICNFTFTSETLLLIHKNTHSAIPDQANKCPLCPTQTFNNKSSLTRHVLASHPLPTPEPFRCTHCGKSFRFLRSLGRHIKDLINFMKHEHRALGRNNNLDHPQHCSTIQGPQLVDVKNRTDLTLSEQYLLEALKNVSSERSNIHVQQLANKSCLLENVQDEGATRDVNNTANGSICNLTISDNVSSQGNIPQVPSVLPSAQNSLPAGPIRFPCHLCLRNFSSKNSLRNHMNRHVTPNTKSVAKMPTNKFADISKVNNEDATKTITTQEQPCDLDPAAQYPSSPLIHSGLLDELIQATPSSKEFSYVNVPISISEPALLHQTPPLSTNVVHTQMESIGSKESDCLASADLSQSLSSAHFPHPVSPRSPSLAPKRRRIRRRRRKNSFERLTTKNTFDRIHRCTTCLKTFTRLYSLKRHEYIHKDFRPHVCQICGASFVQSSSLASHLLIHTDERPYRCNVCNKRFRQRTHLRLHIAALHPTN